MSLIFCRKSHHKPATLVPAQTPCLISKDLHTVGRDLVIARFPLLLLSGTLFQMMSGVPHHYHPIILVWRNTCFVQLTETELYPWSLYICAWFGLVIDLLTAFLKNALMYCFVKSSWLSAYLLLLDIACPHPFVVHRLLNRLLADFALKVFFNNFVNFVNF